MRIMQNITEVLIISVIPMFESSVNSYGSQTVIDGGYKTMGLRVV